MISTEIDAIDLLTSFAREVKSVLRQEYIGTYFTGSLALGDFQPGKSDIDFVIVVDKMTVYQTTAIVRLHKKFSRSNRDKDLNGFVVKQDDLLKHASESKPLLSFNDGKLNPAGFDITAVTLFELKTTCGFIDGKKTEELVIEVSIDDVLAFQSKNIEEYWRKWIDRHASPLGKGMLLVAFPRLSEWLLLGIARQIYTLKTGEITSKTEAGRFVIVLLPNQYRQAVEEAIHIRLNSKSHLMGFRNGYYLVPSLRRASATISCARVLISLYQVQH